jgi:hypothetical protein
VIVVVPSGVELVQLSLALAGIQQHAAVDACAERAVGDQVHQIAIGAVH